MRPQKIDCNTEEWRISNLTATSHSFEQNIIPIPPLENFGDTNIVKLNRCYKFGCYKFPDTLTFISPKLSENGWDSLIDHVINKWKPTPSSKRDVNFIKIQGEINEIAANQINVLSPNHPSLIKIDLTTVTFNSEENKKLIEEAIDKCEEKLKKAEEEKAKKAKEWAVKRQQRIRDNARLKQEQEEEKKKQLEEEEQNKVALFNSILQDNGLSEFINCATKVHPSYILHWQDDKGYTTLCLAVQHERLDIISHIAKILPKYKLQEAFYWRDIANHSILCYAIKWKKFQSFIRLLDVIDHDFAEDSHFLMCIYSFVSDCTPLAQLVIQQGNVEMAKRMWEQLGHAVYTIKNNIDSTNLEDWINAIKDPVIKKSIYEIFYEPVIGEQEFTPLDDASNEIKDNVLPKEQNSATTLNDTVPTNKAPDKPPIPQTVTPDSDVNSTSANHNEEVSSTSQPKPPPPSLSNSNLNVCAFIQLCSSVLAASIIIPSALGLIPAITPLYATMLSGGIFAISNAAFFGITQKKPWVGAVTLIAEASSIAALAYAGFTFIEPCLIEAAISADITIAIVTVSIGVITCACNMLAQAVLEHS